MKRWHVFLVGEGELLLRTFRSGRRAERFFYEALRDLRILDRAWPHLHLERR